MARNRHGGYPCATRGLRHALALSLALAGCTGNDGNEPSTVPVAMVGGVAISPALFERYAIERTGAPPDQLESARRSLLLEDLRRLRAAALLGERKMTRELATELELRRLELIARRAASSAGVDAEPGNAELRAAYEEYISGLPGTEHRVAHILVATPSVANELIERLAAGGDFSRLAAEESADSTGSKGGDLGWLGASRLPAAFTDAVHGLKPGDVTMQPVQTPYGWHVIKLLEARAAAPPAYESVVSQLSANLRQQRYAQFLQRCLDTFDGRVAKSGPD